MITNNSLKHLVFSFGCGFFAYSWKLPAYSGAFLLTVDNFSFFTYNWSFFAYSFSFFTYSWSFFAYSGKVRLVRAFRDCKQRSLTVSKKAPTVSKKASPFIDSVHTRCIVKTSGFTRGVCKNRGFVKFKGFLVEFLENKRSWENRKPPKNRQKSGLFWASPFTMHLVWTLLNWFRNILCSIAIRDQKITYSIRTD